MKANPQDVLTAKIYFSAAFPALRVPLEEDEKQRKAFEKVNAIVEFRAADVRRYFLYTNTDCNVGFYERRGLNRRITHVAHAHGRSMAYYLYDASMRQ